MSQSQALQRKARKIIPGVAQLLSKRPDRFSSGVWPGYYSKAKGATVWDLDGNAFLDMSIGGIGACVLGYADNEVDEAVIEAVRGGVASSLNCPEDVALAETLCTLHPWADMARFSRGGAEAMTIAVRLARAATKRDVVAFCGYHGWSDWYLAANLGDTEALDGHLIRGLEPAGVPRSLQGTALPFRYNNLDELAEIVRTQGLHLAAIVMEAVRSEPPAPGFIEGVRGLADESGAILIVDEISAAFRMNTGGAHLAVWNGIEPDMAVFSKALGNGYAISAVIGRASVMEAAHHTFISSTNWTERVGPTAALATIAKYARIKPYEQFARQGRRIKEHWSALGGRYGFDVHAEGMDAMSHFSINDPAFLSYKAYYVQLMLEQGILASNLCYLMAAHTDADIDRYIEASSCAFAAMAEARDAGDLEKRLKGSPATSGFARLA